MDSVSLIPHQKGSPQPVHDTPLAGPDHPALIVDAIKIIDTEAVRAEMALTAEMHDDDGDRSTALTAILRKALDDGRAVISHAFTKAPLEGRAAAKTYCWLTDQIVILAGQMAMTWFHTAHTPTTNERVSIIAVGGYGRAEMAPFSDVDLLFLIHHKLSHWNESVIERVLHTLYDLRLKVGSAVRTVDDCLRLARDDITIRTSLLERRYLLGDEDLFDALGTRLTSELFSQTGPEFVEAKLAERDARHQRFGGSRYLLEPNLKEAKGGLRDLQTLFWIAKYLYDADSTADLVEKGIFSREENEIFQEAEGFLWSVRCHLHLLAGRANEKLGFDVQVELAERLGFKDMTGRRAVELFMQAYFMQAKAVGDLTRILCSMLETRHVKKNPSIGRRVRRALGFGHRLADGFVERGGRVAFVDEDMAIAEPLLMMQLFREGLRTGLLIHPDAFRLVSANNDLIAIHLQQNEEAQAIFFELLLESGDPERALRRMNETGALGAFLPEFGRTIALMQFNMYHHYTVDEHSIACVAIMARIERGELTEELPLVSEILDGKIDRKVLYTAILLHDAGKAVDGDHSVTGAEIARHRCPLLGMSEAETEMVTWLIRHHLLMSDMAQKRDIADPRTVREFLREVTTLEKLKMLTVLTVCDIRGVGPGVWNNWKAQLLRQLYRDAEALLPGGEASPGPKAREEHAKKVLAEKLAGTCSPEAIAAELDRHFTPYWLYFNTDAHLLFAKMAKSAKPDKISFKMIPDEAQDTTRAVFYLADHPGIFSRLAGALAMVGANVVEARTYTTSDGYALSMFWVQDADGKPYEKSRLSRLRRSVDETLSGDRLASVDLMARNKVKPRQKSFEIPTEIRFDNEGSERFTMIEVSALDRPGLLHSLSYALYVNNVSIASAVIATYGAEAVDTFYVNDLTGRKLDLDRKQGRLTKALTEAVDQVLAAQ